MPARRTRALIVAAAGLLSVGILASSSLAALNATATISTSQTSAPFNYTITLHNTGTTDIGTFWFSWVPTPTSYDFLPSMPTNISVPSGWLNPVQHNGIPGDGYSIEWYNYFGSNIAAGDTQTFTFTSNETPATIAGPAWFDPTHNSVNTSFVYIGFPETDPGLKLNVQAVPEPTALGLIGASIGLATLARRRDRAIGD